MSAPSQLPSVDQFDETTNNFFGTNRGGPQWNDFEEEDELPMGRNTLKARSKEIVISKGQSPVNGGVGGVLGLGGIENNGAFRHQENYRVQPPMGYIGAGLGGAGFPSGGKPPLPQGGSKSSSHAPSSGGSGWQISDDMMKQPWGSVLRQLNNQPRR